MHLVQILLPIGKLDNKAAPAHHALRAELTDRFGGLTAYTRAPAEGLWQPEDRAATERDDILILEVMAETLDAAWWASLRYELETSLDEEEIVIRAMPIERL